MGDFDKFIVAISVGFGWLIRSAMLSGGEDRKWSRYISKNVEISVTLGLAIILLLIFCAHLFTKSTVVYQFWSISGFGFPIGPLSRALVGMLAGFLLAQFFRVASESNAVMSATYLVPFLLLFASAYFTEEIRQGTLGVKKFEAVGIGIEFIQPVQGTSRIVDGPLQFASGQSDSSDSGQSDYETPFVLGMRHLMPQSIDRFSSDVNGRWEYCETFTLFQCAGYGTADDEVSGPDDPSRLQMNTNLIDFEIALVSKYFDLISPYVECLKEDYVTTFPGGMPIQSALYRAATAFTSAVDDPLFDDVNTRWSTIDRLTGWLHQFDQYKAAHFGGLAQAENRSDSPCKAFEHTSADLITDGNTLEVEVPQDDLFGSDLTCNDVNIGNVFDTQGILDEFQSNLRVYINRVYIRRLFTPAQKSWSVEQKDALVDHLVRERMLRLLRTEFNNCRPVLPYLAMFEAATITSAGFPAEAARHLERARELYESRLTDRFVDEDRPIDKAPFIERNTIIDLISSSRIYFMLDRLYEETGVTRKRYDRNREYTERLGAFFRANVVNFSPNEPAALVAWCAQNLGNQHGDDTIFPSITVSGEDQSDVSEQAKGWLKAYIEIFVRQNLREFRPFSELPNIHEESARARSLVRRSRNLARLTQDNNDGLFVCFGQGDTSDRSSSYIESFKFQILAVHSILLTRVADAFVNQRVDVYNIGAREQRMFCDASDAAREALVIASDRRAGSASVDSSSDLYRIVQQLHNRFRSAQLQC